jgi:2-C-methyl-D-erythritol 4-phosphate cytidylyltransferase
MATVAVILPAAGKSVRFGGKEKKPFATLDGRAVWQRSAELFWTRSDVTKVYVVVAPEDRDLFRSKFGHVIAFANAEVVDGGAERFESVANALARIPPEVDLVAVHDAVRPLVTSEQIDAVFAAATAKGAAMLAIPVADTLKQVEGATHRVSGTVSRAGLWQAQTPQVCRRDWMVEAYAKRNEFGKAITDDAQLIEAAGHPVYVVPGSLANFKVTSREDLELAEAVLKSRASKKPPPAAHPFADEAKW